MTQQELANRAGARRETISRLEKGSTILHRTLPGYCRCVFPAGGIAVFVLRRRPVFGKMKERPDPIRAFFQRGIIPPQTALQAPFFPVTEPYEIDCAQQKLYNSGSRRCQPHAEQRDRLHPAHDPRHWNPHKMRLRSLGS